MKKYLMMGAAALTMGFAFVSCSSDDEIYNPKAKSEQLAKNYAEAFVQQFGQPAANQTWGFGETAKARQTRAEGDAFCDTDGKFWLDDKSLLPVPAPITAAERAAVYAEFSKVHNDLGETIDWSDYYVQQVWSSKNDPANTYTSFHGQNGGNEVQQKAASSHMNLLLCGLSDTHSNNFNANGTSPIELWNGKDYRTDGQKATYYDSIQLIRNCDTKRFGYHNSLDSKDHYEYIILKVNGSYYVGFDFCASYSFNTRTADGGFVKERYDQDPGEEFDTNFNGYTLRSNDEVVYNSDGTIKGYKGGDKDIHRDHKYNDWIVKISPAKQVTEPVDEVKEQGRIFCEDLGTIGDFDFNDVVFDAKLYKSGKIEIDVLAAGGTLPIAVAGEDITIGKMSNTGVNNGRPTQHISISAEEATTNGWTSLISIPIVVTRDITDAVDGSVELTAEEGKAPQKICVPLTTDWVDEYVNINTAYPNFAKWVKKEVTRENCFANANKVAKYVDLILQNND